MTLGRGTLTLPATYGPVELWEREGAVHFRAQVVGEHPSDYPALVRRMQLAVEAGVAAATGISCTATPDLTTYSVDGRPALNIGVGASATITVTAAPDASERAAEAARAVLLSSDERLAELWEVYLLGLRALTTVAHPVVGLWAFSTVLEEETPGSLSGIRGLADRLRSKGFSLPSNPQRHPAAIRAAALHASPKADLPTHEEVVWFQLVAKAYLQDRASEGRTAPSVRPLKS